jgi:ABC-type transport system substrate-binding protein
MLFTNRVIWGILGGILLFLISISLIAEVAYQEPVRVENLTPDDYLFSVHLLIPVSSSSGRLVLPQQIAENLGKIGIGSEVDIVSWARLGPRATDQEVGMYSEGGYDICFFGMSLGSPAGHPGSSMQVVYKSTAIPPQGFNVPYWSPVTGRDYNNLRAQESDDLIDEINTNLNLTEARLALYEWQKVWYDVMPNIIIYNQYEVHAIGSDYFGYDPVGYPFASVQDQWFEGGDGSETAVLAASTGGDTFISVIATDVYDQYSGAAVLSSLVANAPSLETVLPVTTDRATWMTDRYGTDVGLDLYASAATAMGAFSADGLQYNITMRDDVYFHDGHQADMWDVAFSFQSILIPAVGASQYSNYIDPFGMDNKTALSGNYSFVVEDKNSDGFFESLSFQLVDTYAPFTTDILGVSLRPEHILGDPVDHGFDGSGNFDVTQWQIQPGNWSTHSMNTGRTSDTGGYAGPIGTGPVYFDSYDATAGVITLKKFVGMKWDGSAWVADAAVNYYDDHLITNMPGTLKIIVSSLDASIAEMKNGGVTILDPQFTMANVLEELQAEATIQPVLSPETGWQSVYMNPKFTQDGVRHLNKKGVRHAISHIIPRNEFIQEWMHGLAAPGYTPVPVTSWGAISEEKMVEYKRSVQATDRSYPLSEASTAYDQYSLELAFTWLETEGYDVDLFKDFYLNKTTIPTFFDELLDTYHQNPNFYYGGIILIVLISVDRIIRSRIKKTP